MLLAVPARIHSQRAFPAHLSALNWNEEDVVCFQAVNAEVVNLTEIVPLKDLRVGMVRIGAACSESDRTREESPGLALHSCEPSAFIDYKVVPQVLSKRDEDRVARTVQRNDDRQL